MLLTWLASSKPDVACLQELSYESAHFDGAESEVVVPYLHTSCTTKPEPIAEVRRILRLHLGMAAD